MKAIQPPKPKRQSKAPILSVAPPITAPAEQSLPLARVIRPEAATRWLGWLARDYTPERIEYLLRDALAGDLGSQWELFSLMEDTWPRLQKALGELKRAVQQMEWEVEPWAEEDESPSDEATRRARVVSHALWTMRPRADEGANGFEGTIFDVLDSWAKGVAVLEVEWETRETPKDGRIIAPLATHWVHPKHYGWQSGRLMLHPPQSSGKDLVPFPPNQFLISICKSRSGPVTGAALLRPLAWWWCAANFSAGWLLNLAQIFGLPIRWATYAPGADQGLVNQICDMLENMGSAAWGAFPSGTSIELKEPSKGGGSWPQDSLLDRADRQVDLLVLGQTLTTDVGNSGSRALGDVHQTVRDGIIAAAADWAATVINQQLIPAIARLNWGDERELPACCPEPREQADLKADADRIAVLIQAGLKIPRDWLYKQQQIPIPAEGDEVVERQEAPQIGVGMTGESTGSTGEANKPTTTEPEDDGPDEFSSEEEVQAARSDPPPATDPSARIAARRAAALGQAYRGALAPVRRLVEESTSKEDLERRLGIYYADWSPGRVAELVEESLQICAAAGAADAVSPSPISAYSPDQPRADDGEWTDGGGAGGGSGGVSGGGKGRLPKMTIKQAGDALANKGWELGQAEPWQPGQKNTVYKVRHKKTGKTVTKTAKEIIRFAS